MKKKAVIAGAGTMGASLAQVYAAAGYEVVLYDLSDDFLEKGKSLIAINQPVMVREGMLTPAQSEAVMAAISYSCSKDCFRDADIVLETIVEDLAVKQRFWEEVSAIAPADALLASNTSGLHITDIAQKMTGPERFMGQHWLNPPHIIPVCELIRGEKTSDETVERMKALVTGLGKRPVVVADINGFITNRLQFALLREALNIVEMGAATMEDVDAVVKYGLGLRYACLGPFEIADFGGLDTFNNITKYLFADLSNAAGQSPALKELVEQGRLGVKSGRGFYDYSEGRAEAAVRRRDEMYIKLAKLLFQ